MSSFAVQVRHGTEGHRGTDRPGRHPRVHRVQRRRRADVEEERKRDQTGRKEVRGGERRNRSSTGDPRRPAG